MKKFVYVLMILLSLGSLTACSSTKNNGLMHESLTFGMTSDQIIDNLGKEPDITEDYNGTQILTYENENIFEREAELELHLKEDGETLDLILYRISDCKIIDYVSIKNALIEEYPVDELMNKDVTKEVYDALVTIYSYVNKDYYIGCTYDDDSHFVYIFFESND